MPNSREPKRGQAIVRVPRGALARTPNLQVDWIDTQPLGRLAVKLVNSAEDDPLVAHFATIATELTRKSRREHVSVAVTAPDRNNGQGFTAIGLASVWARWGQPSLLVNLGDRELAEAVPPTYPGIVDLVHALERKVELPELQSIRSVRGQLDVLSQIEPWSLARLADMGVLESMFAGLRDRYARFVWALPVIGCGWTPSMVRDIVEHTVVSARRGKALQRPIKLLADQMASVGAKPPQLIWHH